MDNKCLIVTGGAQGIGLGITKELLRRNYKIAVLDIDVEALEALSHESASPDLLAINCDVCSEASIQKAIDKTVETFGNLYALVNNAGIADPHSGPIESLDLVSWRRWLDTNLTSAFLTTKHALPHLRKTEGSIINIASTRALQSEANTEAYAASKGGLVSLTHALALSLSGSVRVNAISPGWISVDAYQKPTKRKQPSLREIDHSQHPAGRVGNPNDIASLVAYLISQEASFITGQNFVVDGGMTKKMIYQE